MENKWEYNYENLHTDRPGDTSTYSTDAACGYQPAPVSAGPAGGPAGGGPGGPAGPQNGEPAPAPAPQPSGHKNHGGKKWLTRALCLVLVAAVGFAGGVAGSRFAGGSNRVIYQSVNRGDTSSSEGSVPEGEAMNTKQVASLVAPSVVVITTEEVVTSNYWFGGQYVESGAGSGVIMTEDGYILTCAHVVSGASSITVTLTDGTEYPATLVGADSQSDIAVIKVKATGLTPAVMGDSDALAVGEDVVAVGNPLGELGGTVTNGIVSALNREIEVNSSTMSVIQTNAAVSPGNSGGGLFNAAGELIGIVNAKSTGDYAEGLGFAIPINTALPVAQDLIENGYVTGRPALGVTVLTISDAQTAAQYGVSNYGVYVIEVNAGSGAEAAGLQAGDMFVSVDNTVVSSTAELTDIISQHQVGDVLSVQISRDRQLLTVDVTLGESAS